MRERFEIWGLAACILGLLACSNSNSQSQNVDQSTVLRRAPFDLECPKGKLSYHRLGSDAMGVKGCGRRATYVKVCRETVDEASSFVAGVTVTDERCQWMMNTAGQRTQD